jgi:4-hydroxy-tetrahydrodipicolinate synthase
MFEGITTALLTPFTSAGSLNLDLVAHLIERQIEAGITAICVTAGAGEYLTLRFEERRELIECASQVIDRRVPLIAGILASNTWDAVAAGRAAHDNGADGLLVLNPPYWNLSPASLVEHFRAVATEVDLPIIVYNNPGRTGLNMDVAVLELLCDIPQVNALKECDRDLGRVARKIERFGHRLTFLSGDDDLCLQSFVMGARGAVMAISNLVPSWPVAIHEAVQQSKLPDARPIFSRLLRLIELYEGPDHPGPLKRMMIEAGYPVGSARAPLDHLDAERLAKIDHVLGEFGLLDG